MDNERRPDEDALEAMNAVVNTPPVRRKKNFFEKNMIPLKGDSKKTRRRKGLFDSCVVIIFVCLLVITWVVAIDPWQAGKKLTDIQGIYNEGTEATVSTTEPPPGETAPPETTHKPVVVRASADKLKARNSDYIGWLKAPGGSINYPIVQTANNNYYLYRDFDRNSSRYGNPFLDYRNSVSPMSDNLIIYGHHMRDGTIFSRLTQYKQAGVVKNNPIITLEMPDGTTYQFKIVSVLAVNGRAQDDNGYIFAVNTPNFPTKENFDGYVKQIKQRSYVNTGVDVQYGDKLISLQTCIYDFTDEYLYVIGRLVRDGESASVDASKIKSNPNPRHPQALCDKLKIKNNFADAERWFPA